MSTTPRENTPSLSGPALSGSAQKLVDKLAAIEIAAPPGARERVWARVSARRAPRRFVWAFAAGATCAAAIALAVLFVGRGPESLGLVIRANGMQRVLHDGDSLTPLAELSLVDLQAAGQLVAGRDTTGRIARTGSAGLDIDLERGTMLLHVRPRHADAPFIVRTSHLRARVVGTILRVTAGPDGESVAVGHGTVEVEDAAGVTHVLHSGEHWPLDAKNVPLKEELERLGPTELEGVTMTAFTGPEAPAVGHPDSPSARYAEKLATGRTASGARAEAALYDAGWLAWRELGDPARALSVWQEADSRFPSGPLSREIDESIIDALVALHRTSDAEHAVEQHLRRHADSPRAGELHFVRATLLRELDGDCHRANAELDRALQPPTGPWSSGARAARKACEMLDRQ